MEKILGLVLIVLMASASSFAGGKHLFILSGQSNMVGMDPDISFSPAIRKAFGEGHVIIVKDAHSGQSIRSWAKSNHEYPPPTFSEG